MIDLKVKWWTAGCTSISDQQGEAAAVVDEDGDDGDCGVGDDVEDGFADHDGGIGDYVDGDDAFSNVSTPFKGTCCYHECLPVLHSDSCDEPTVFVESF